jgi:hypothetical protein
VTEGITGRIHDRLVTRFGEDGVFIDVDNIPDGVNFRQHLAKHIKRCELMVAVIGDDWLRKIRTNEDDFVRIELELAHNYGLHILPVLVGSGRVPTKRQLPATLKWLPDINSPYVSSGRDFEAHARRLIKSIEGLLANGRPDTDEIPVAAPPAPEPKEQPKPAETIPAPLQARKRVWRYALGVALLAGLGVAGVSLKMRGPKRGRLLLSVVPRDATAWLDGRKVPAGIILTAAGNHLLAVARDGYVRNEQKVDLRADESMDVSVILEPSPDTGFELWSDPPGGLVWLDGAPISGSNGQARTDFRASRIPPGHHVLEIKGENRFRAWRQDIEVAPGEIRKIRATLIPAAPPEPEPKPEPIRATKHRSPPSAAPTPVRSQAEILSNPYRDSDCFITIGSRPWAELWIDGKNTNRPTPLFDYKVPCGKHKLTFKRPDLQIEQTETITVSPSERFKQSYALLND